MDSLEDFAEEWAETLHEQSAGTRMVYERSVRQFREWLAVQHADVLTPGQITRRHVHGWMGALTAAGQAEGTRRVRLIAVRLWLGYLAGEPDSGLASNPAEGIELPTPKVQPVPVVHDQDLTTLLRSTEGTSFIHRRDHAALRVLIDTGCRRAELVGIDVDDVDLRAHEIVLHRTKGGRGRIVPIGSKTALAMRKYLRARAKHPAAGTDALFLSTRVGNQGGARMTGGGLAEMIHRRCDAAKITTFGPHRLRHTWASDMLAHGAAEGDVEKLAGWRSPLMIRRYTASTADQRARDAAKRLRRGDRV